jgi:hypothetical protein
MQVFISFLFIVAIISMILIVFFVVRKIDRCRIEVEVYSTSKDKFRKKYLKTFLRINLLYIGAFIMTRLVPVAWGKTRGVI